MGNRAKKAKKHIVRAPKASTPAKPSPLPPSPTALISPLPLPLNLSFDFADMSRLRPSRFKPHRLHPPTVTPPSRQPAPVSGLVNSTYLLRLPEEQRKHLLSQYFQTRSLIPLPEITLPFPYEEMLSSDTAFHDYRHRIENITAQFSKQKSLAEAEQWSAMEELDPQKRRKYDEETILNILHYWVRYDQQRAAERLRREEKRKTEHEAKIQRVKELGSGFWQDMYIGLAFGFGRRVKWRNSKTRGSVYYDTFPARSFSIPHPQSARELHDSGKPLAQHAAETLAKQNAAFHRLYSEAMGLWHSPYRPEVRHQLGLSIPEQSEAVLQLVHRVYLFRRRWSTLRRELNCHIRQRQNNPIYHPGRHGDFHNGFERLHLSSTNAALNAWPRTHADEAQLIRSNILMGGDTATWHAFDPRELCLAMNALRGYSNDEDNFYANPTLFRRFHPYPKKLKVPGFITDSGPIPTPDAEALKKGMGEKVKVENALEEDRFIINEPRCLQALTLMTEVNQLGTSLRGYIEHHLELKDWWLRPNENMQSDPHITLWANTPSKVVWENGQPKKLGVPKVGGMEEVGSGMSLADILTVSFQEGTATAGRCSIESGETIKGRAMLCEAQEWGKKNSNLAVFRLVQGH